MFDRIYVATLEWSLRHRWVIVAVSVAVFASTFPLADHIGRDFLPQDDQNELMVTSELPEGSSLEATEKFGLRWPRRSNKIPGVIAVIPQSSPRMARVSMAFFNVLLKPADERGDINQMAVKVRQVLYPEFAYGRPRINFPNLLGGMDSFAPIRGHAAGTRH